MCPMCGADEYKTLGEQFPLVYLVRCRDCGWDYRVDLTQYPYADEDERFEYACRHVEIPSDPSDVGVLEDEYDES